MNRRRSMQGAVRRDVRARALRNLARRLMHTGAPGALMMVGAIANVVSPASAVAQQVATAAKAGDASDSLVLSRPVTVRLQDMTLRDAIVAVGDAAHIRLVYRKGVLDAVTHPVTLSVTNMPLGKAFERLLDGTQLAAVPVQGDIVSIEPTAAVHHAMAGSVSGRVYEAANKRPVYNAIVTIEGTKIGTRTGEDGAFRITGVAAGTYRVLARRIGYQSASVPVTVKDDSAATVVIVLQTATTVLNEVVTTATGERPRLEVGNAVGTIKADSIVSTNVIRNVSDLLQARVPGLIVQNTDGAVGSPSRIRLRGISSVALNNDPIVILDGVRLNTQTTIAPNETNVGSGTGLNRFAAIGNSSSAPTPSRLDDIDPNTIESIDVLRGPSASSLYGTDAANGVIVIKTKRGVAGHWRSSLLADDGRSFYPGKFPEMWWGYWENQGGNSVGGDCLLATGSNTVTGGSCTQDSVRQFNPQNDPQMTTIGTGSSRSLSASLSGGTESLRQFLSLRASDQVGTPKMSAVEARNIARLWSSPAPPWMKRPNTEQDYDGSSATTFQINPKTDVVLTTNGIYRTVLNGGTGLIPVGVFQGASPSDTLSFLPSEGQKTKSTSTAKRGVLSGVGNYNPYGWLHLTGTVGGDYTLRTDQADVRAQDCTTILALATGNTTSYQCPSGHEIRRDETFLTTVNGGANFSFSPSMWLDLRTSIGEQYTHTNFYTMDVGNGDLQNCPLAFGTQLLSPAPVCINPGSQQFRVNEDQDEAATAGWYVEQTIGLFGLYTTLGKREDVASAFGGSVNKSPPSYPKFNLSYPVSEQSFFPKQPYVSSLRLRLAYGQSGNQASQTAVYNYYAVRQVEFSNSSNLTNIITLNQLGNVNLKPERGTEWEGGFDVSFLANERIHLEATMSRKHTRDAIVLVQQPLSYGVDNTGQYVNIGDVENRSLELLGRFRVFDTRPLSWDVTVTRTQASNKLVRAADPSNTYGPSDANNFTEGYPLFGLWGVPVVSYDDRNHDGILAMDEVAFGTKRFMGAPYPKSQMVYSSDMGFFNQSLHITSTFERISGQTTAFYMNYGFYPRAAVDPTAPLGQQAAWIEATINNNAYLAESNSLRWNELSVTYSLPSTFAARLLHAQYASITFAGRNLALWTTYAGKDPNVDASQQLGESTYDFGMSLPQPRNLLLRVNLGL